MSQTSPYAVGQNTMFITSIVTRRFHNGTLQLSPSGRYFKIEQPPNSAGFGIETVLCPKVSVCGYHVTEKYPGCNVSNDMPVSPTASEKKTGRRWYAIAERVKSFILSKIFKLSKDDVATETEFSKHNITQETIPAVSSSENSIRRGMWGRLMSTMWKSDLARSTIPLESQSSTTNVTSADCNTARLQDDLSLSSVRVLWTRRDPRDLGSKSTLRKFQDNEVDRRTQDLSTTTKDRSAGQESGVTVHDEDWKPSLPKNDTLDDIFSIDFTTTNPITSTRRVLSKRSLGKRCNAFESPIPGGPIVRINSHHSSRTDLEITPVRVHVNSFHIKDDSNRRSVDYLTHHLLHSQILNSASVITRALPGVRNSSALPFDDKSVINDTKSTRDEYVEFMYGSREKVSAKDNVLNIQRKTKGGVSRLGPKCRSYISSVVCTSKKCFKSLRKKLGRNLDLSVDNCNDNDVFVDTTS